MPRGPGVRRPRRRVMFKVRQDGDLWLAECDGEAHSFSTYGEAVGALKSHYMTAAVGDGLLPEAWTSDMVFQEPTGDGRDFSRCNFTWRDPSASTMPLMFQTET